MNFNIDLHPLAGYGPHIQDGFLILWIFFVQLRIYNRDFFDPALLGQLESGIEKGNEDGFVALLAENKFEGVINFQTDELFQTFTCLS